MLIPAGALSKLLDLLQINCDEKDLLNAIHTAKKELIGDTTSKDAMEMRSHGTFVWNSMVRRSNAATADETSILKLVAFGSELAYMIMRGALAELIDNDSQLQLCQMACQTSQAFLRVEELGLAEQYLAESADIKRSLGVLSTRQQRDFIEYLIGFHAIKIMLTYRREEPFIKSCEGLKRELKEDMIARVIEQVAEMVCFNSAATPLWKTLLESPQLAGHVSLIRKYYMQYAINRKDLNALRQLVSDDPDFALMKEGHLAQAIVSCASGESSKVSGLKVCELLTLYDFLESSVDDARHLSQTLITYEYTLNLNLLSPQDLVSLATIKVRSFLRTELEKEGFGPGDLVAFLQGQLYKIELAPEKGDLEASLYRLCQRLFKRGQFTESTKITELLVRLTDVKENRQRYSLLQARCCLNSGDAPGALRILNSMERGDLKLLARIEVVLHDNQFAKTASTLKSVSYIRDFNQIALRSILDEFSQSKPSRELVIEAGRLLYDAGCFEESVHIMEDGLSLFDRDPTLLTNVIIISGNHLKDGHARLLKMIPQVDQSKDVDLVGVIDTAWNCGVNLYRAGRYLDAQAVVLKALDLIRKNTPRDDQRFLALAGLALDSFLHSSCNEDTALCETLESISKETLECLEDEALVLHTVLSIKKARFQSGSKSSARQTREVMEQLAWATRAIICIRQEGVGQEDLIKACGARDDRTVEMIVNKLINYEMDRVPFNGLQLALLELARQVTESKRDGKVVVFAMLLRGLIIALIHEDSFPHALGIFRQALEVIRLVENFPEDESLWLLATSFNASQSLIECESNLAREYCEISMQLLAHLQGKPCVSGLDKQIRQGYAKIIFQLS